MFSLWTWSWIAIAVSNGVLTFGVLVTLFARRREVRALADPKVPTDPRGAEGRVAIVRPLCGLERDAEKKNAALLAQTHRPRHVWFVAERADDAAWLGVRALSASQPEDASCLVAGQPEEVLSRKARSMIRGYSVSDAPFVAFCDADLCPEPELLATCMRAFEDPRVGGVFAPCLFDAPGPAGRLVMHVATLDKFTMAVAGARFGLVPCLEGGFMVFRRTAVESAGGIGIIANAIADDQRLARALRSAGWSLAVAETPIVHLSGREDTRLWARRFHRWMVCQRSEQPTYAMIQLVLHPVAIPLLAALAGAGVLPLLVTVAWRFLLAAAMNGRIARDHGVSLGVWVLARPISDVAHFVIALGSFVVTSVVWAGHRYVMGWNGNIREVFEIDDAPSASEGVHLIGAEVAKEDA